MLIAESYSVAPGTASGSSSTVASSSGSTPVTRLMARQLGIVGSACARHLKARVAPVALITPLRHATEPRAPAQRAWQTDDKIRRGMPPLQVSDLPRGVAGEKSR